MSLNERQGPGGGPPEYRVFKGNNHPITPAVAMERGIRQTADASPPPDSYWGEGTDSPGRSALDRENLGPGTARIKSISIKGKGFDEHLFSQCLVAQFFEEGRGEDESMKLGIIAF